MASRTSSLVATACWVRILCCFSLLGGCALVAVATPSPPPARAPGEPINASTHPSSLPAPQSSWDALTPAQRQALAPFATEWNRMETVRKKKWLEIANKFSTMKPNEQQRVQARMREWAKLTPEQRRIARENYAKTKKLNRDQKSAHWQQYQQLPEEQKKKLAADTSSKRRSAAFPPAQSKNKTFVPPPSKPVVESSAAPSAPPIKQPSAP